MNIIAVVVTYNRMELLKRNIRCLQQNKPISSIVIVNNGSTDGTTEWLAAQEGLTVINQTNVGGAGGFYTGIQYAYPVWNNSCRIPTRKISAYWPLAGCSKEKYSPMTSRHTT